MKMIVEMRIWLNSTLVAFVLFYSAWPEIAQIDKQPQSSSSNAFMNSSLRKIKAQHKSNVIEHFFTHIFCIHNDHSKNHSMQWTFATFNTNETVEWELVKRKKNEYVKEGLLNSLFIKSRALCWYELNASNQELVFNKSNHAAE